MYHSVLSPDILLVQREHRLTRSKNPIYSANWYDSHVIHLLKELKVLEAYKNIDVTGIAKH